MTDAGDLLRTTEERWSGMPDARSAEKRESVAELNFYIDPTLKTLRDFSQMQHERFQAEGVGAGRPKVLGKPDEDTMAIDAIISGRATENDKDKVGMLLAFEWNGIANPERLDPLYYQGKFDPEESAKKILDLEREVVGNG